MDHVRAPLAGYYMDRYRYVGEANAAGSIATFTFTGTGIDWHSVKATNQGIGEVRLDSGAWVPIDLYTSGATQRGALIWTTGPSGLTNGTHTVEVRHTGAHTAGAASPYAVGIDRFVVYTEPDLTISASVSGSGGSISPSGASSVVYGSNATYAITPDSGQQIADVEVDGGSVGAVGSYTFTNVTANHTIVASFEPTPVVSTPASSRWSIIVLAGLGVAALLGVRRFTARA